MPGVPQPVGENGVLQPWWNHVIQSIRRVSQQAAALNSGASQQNLVDQHGNTVQITGTNLSQVVTIGADFQQPGVLVGTGIANGTAGQVKQQSLAIGKVTVTAGSLTATLVSTTSGTFANGMMIGAANVSDPSTGTATPAIQPGTSMTISGSTITLSKPAAETGTALYAAACTFA